MAVVSDNRAEFDALLKRLGELPKLRLTVGVHGTDKRRDPDGSSGSIGNVGVAAVHEFGAPERNIPQRSFIRATLDRVRSVTLDEMDSIVGRVAQGEKPQQAVQGLALQLVEEIRETIRAGIAPSLAESTLKARESRSRPLNTVWKGRATPLIDTGQLIQSVKGYVARSGASVGSGEGVG